jgi:hypothetical protein
MQPFLLFSGKCACPIGACEPYVDGDEDVLRTSTTGSEQRASRIDFVDYNLENVFLSFLSIFLSFFLFSSFISSFFLFFSV